MELRHETSMVFHSREYLLSLEVEAEGDSLSLQVEDKSTGERWHGQFSARYIEEITHKTGNFKKFSVFLKMLVTALSPPGSDTVFVDLLTYNDLEMLKNRKAARKQPASTAAKQNNKRYLILTYAVEFDRVHYPLPLQFDAHPDTAALQKTIERLRAELADANGRQAPAAAAEAPNAELEAELEAARARIARLEAKPVSEREQGSQRLKKRINELEDELSTVKRAAGKSKKQIAKLTEELEKSQQAERRFRLKCRELSSELQMHQKRRLSPNLAERRSRSPGAARTSSRERGGFVAPRPSSAPNSRAARFDPTAYQRDKERRTRERLSRIAAEKERLVREHGRTSRPSSAERTRSRANSAERSGSRGSRGGGSRPGSAERRSSAERQRGRSPVDGRARASPSERKSRERPKSGGKKRTDKENRKAVRDVTNEKTAAELFTKGAKRPAADPALDVEISDIDARLNALQDFLKTAKNY